MIRETKADYIERTALFMPREMGPHLPDLVMPCTCGLGDCRGWKVSSMVRAELPEGARTAKPKPREKEE